MLKGCEQAFRAGRPQERYCSAGCQAEARRWSTQRARERYRATQRGRESRRQQAARYRQRERERSWQKPSEGDHSGRVHDGELCARPGCWERFIATRRSPLQRFCGAACRRALTRVVERERRWLVRARARSGQDAHGCSWWSSGSP